MRCSHRQQCSIFFSVKTPFTHRFQITSKFCDIVNQKLPLNGCASQCCVCKHEGVYAISIFVLIFCQTFTFFSVLLAMRRHITNGFKPNYTTRSNGSFPLQCQICALCHWQHYNTTALGRVKCRAEHASKNNVYTLFAFHLLLLTAIGCHPLFSLDICIKSRNAQNFCCSQCFLCVAFNPIMHRASVQAQLP